MNKKNILSFILWVAAFLLSNLAFAVSKKVVASGLEIPWAIQELPDGDLLISERQGQIKRLNLKTGKIVSIAGVPAVYNAGQGGLLDLELHPDFAKNKYVYITYSKRIKEKTNTTALTRAVLNNNKLEDVKELFQADPPYESTHHFGSRIAFDKKGYVFISVGERNERHFAQQLSSHLGKIIRLKDDGTVPTDNPFYGQKDKKAEIWSYGHRNPQGLWYDHATNVLYVSEHGPRGGDEINKVIKGKNYGWPVVTHGKEYWGPSIGDKKKEGMEDPIKIYVPSIAPSDLIIYSGKVIKDWKGSFLQGALVLTHLNRVAFDGEKVGKEERYFEREAERVRSLVETRDGNLYLGVDIGEIWQVLPN